MKLLTVVNYCLKYLGEKRVSSVDTRHPTVNDIVLEVDDQINTLLSRGWWFNERTQRTILIMKAILLDLLMHLWFLVHLFDVDIIDGYMWDIVNDTNIFSSPIEVTVRHKVNFEDLPEVAADYIKCAVAYVLYAQEYGAENTIQTIIAQRSEAQMYLEREELRKRKYNSTQRSAVFRFVSALRG